MASPTGGQNIYLDAFDAGQQLTKDLPNIIEPIRKSVAGFVADLRDMGEKVAKPFKQARDAVTDFSKGVRSVNPALDSFANKVTESSNKIKASISELYDKFKDSGGFKTPFSLGLDAVTGIVSGLWEGVKAFAKMALDAASFREESVAGFKAVLGSAERADNLFNHALEVAKLTKYETQDVVTMYNGLVARGFKEDELDTITAAISDVSSARGEAAGKRYENALSKLRGAGIAKFGTYQQAYMSGAGAEMTNKELGKILGLSETDPAKLAAKINDMMRAKQVTSNQAILANFNAVQNLYDPDRKDENGNLKKGKLGDYSLAQSQTISGLFSTAKSAFGDMVMGLDVTNLPGIQSFKKFLMLNLELLNSNSAEGKRLQEIVKNLINDIFSVFNVSPDKSKKAFGVILDIAEKLEKRVKIVATFIRDELIPGVLDMINSIADGGSFMDKLKSAFIAIAKLAGQALAVGFLAAMGFEDRSKEVEDSLNGKKGKGTGKSSNPNYKDNGWIPTPTEPTTDDKPILPAEPDKAKEMNDFGPQVGAAKGGGQAVGYGFGLGLSQGIEDSKPVVQESVMGLATKPEKDLRTATDTHSPSGMYRKIGQGWGEGLSYGIKDMYGAVSEDLKGFNDLSDWGMSLATNARSTENLYDLKPEAKQTSSEIGGNTIYHINQNIQATPSMDVEELADLAIEKIRMDLGIGNGRLLRNPNNSNL